MTKIVLETPEQFDAVHQMTAEAFAASDLGHNGEADLIESIRNQCDTTLSLVALDEECVVGHILFSPATIRSDSLTVHGMGLAPMAVLPSRQRHGIGSMMVTEGLRRLSETDAQFTLVAGHPDYYPRFGFLPAQQLSVRHGFDGMPQDFLFIRVFDENMVSKLSNGLAYYHSAFGPQHVE